MAFTHTLTVAYADERSTVINLSVGVSGTNAGVDISDMVNTNEQKTYDVAIAVAMIVSLLLYSNQPMTVMTNDATSPQDLITLKAGYPVIWTINAHWPVPFKGDVSQLILKNEGAAAANVEIRVLSSS